MTTKKGNVMKKVAVVTGGASGIGLATGKLLAKKGYMVVLADKNAGIDRSRNRALQIRKCDVSSYEEVEALFRWVKQKFGRLDVLVNCAGVHYSSRNVHEENVEDFDRLVRTNIYGTYYCCHEALKLMKQGVIVNIGSSVSIAADPAAAAYSASKAWVAHFTRCLAQQYGKTVRCNTVSPGPVDTPFLRNAFGNDPVALEEIKKFNPAGRIATPDEIAATILHVIESPNINGANIPTDGGESVFYWEPPKPV